MQLAAANSYSGPTLVTGGTLDFAAASSLASAGNLNATGGGVLSIGGTVTMAARETFGVGSGITGTTGTVIVNAGGAARHRRRRRQHLYRRRLHQCGRERAKQRVWKRHPHRQRRPRHRSRGRRQRQQRAWRPRCDRFWLDPYGGTGSAINLNGGTLSTARPIANGSGTPAYFNFNGGTLQAAAKHQHPRQRRSVNGRRAGRRSDDRHQRLQRDRRPRAAQRRWRRRADQDRRRHADLERPPEAPTRAARRSLPAPWPRRYAGSSTASSLPPGQPITVNAGATLQMNATDALGYYGGNPSLITLNGGVLTNNGGAFHDTLPAFNLTAGTITAASAGDAGGLNYIFDGTITTNAASSAVRHRHARRDRPSQRPTHQRRQRLGDLQRGPRLRAGRSAGRVGPRQRKRGERAHQDGCRHDGSLQRQHLQRQYADQRRHAAVGQ